MRLVSTLSKCGAYAYTRSRNRVAAVSLSLRERYSTPFEFNNSRNSRQSLFSGIGVAAVAEFDKDSQALLRGHRRVVARVGLISVLEAGKYPHRLLHAHIIARWVGMPSD